MNKFRLFSYLRWKNDKSNLLANTSDKRYYDKHSYLLSRYSGLDKYDDALSDFGLIKTVIVLRSLENKIKIDEGVDLYQEANLSSREADDTIHGCLPFLRRKNGMRIYVPFFSELYNKCYDKKLSLLLIPPYNTLKTDFGSEIVNPFDYYGFELFKSSFSNLIYLCQSSQNELAAFYSVELETIYVIDNQGCLEEKIPIFDDYLSYRAKDHLVGRLQSLMKLYFDDDREAFIDSLYNFKLLSCRTYNYILMKENINNGKK
ncbi:MAG: hypothetical protein PHW22_03705 [Bacilli bacterium]|nr:hypothetical protein [Bacilli bacterium]